MEISLTRLILTKSIRAHFISKAYQEEAFSPFGGMGSLGIKRNSFMFQNARPDLYRCRGLLKEELNWIKFQVPEKDYAPFHHG
jgi:hypothetical protein